MEAKEHKAMLSTIAENGGRRFGVSQFPGATTIVMRFFFCNVL